jgi:hypothetical protein
MSVTPTFLDVTFTILGRKASALQAGDIRLALFIVLS